MAGVRAAFLLAALTPSAALACKPAPVQPAAAPTVAADCSVQWALEDFRAIGLGPADRKGRLIVQEIYDGNACYWRTGLIVHDCPAGQVLTIGFDDNTLMRGPAETGLDRVLVALDNADIAEALGDVADRARREGFGTVETMDAGASLEIDGHALPLDCACRAPGPGPQRTDGDG